MKNTGLMGEVFALKPVTESSVLASISRSLRISTKRLKWRRKSELRIGYGKSAKVKNCTWNRGGIYRLQCDG